MNQTDDSDAEKLANCARQFFDRSRRNFRQTCIALGFPEPIFLEEYLSSELEDFPIMMFMECYLNTTSEETDVGFEHALFYFFHLHKEGLRGEVLTDLIKSFGSYHLDLERGWASLRVLRPDGPLPHHLDRVPMPHTQVRRNSMPEHVNQSTQRVSDKTFTTSLPFSGAATTALDFSNVGRQSSTKDQPTMASFDQQHRSGESSRSFDQHKRVDESLRSVDQQHSRPTKTEAQSRQELHQPLPPQQKQHLSRLTKASSLLSGTSNVNSQVSSVAVLRQAQSELRRSTTPTQKTTGKPEASNNQAQLSSTRRTGDSPKPMMDEAEDFNVFGGSSSKSFGGLW